MNRPGLSNTRKKTRFHKLTAWRRGNKVSKIFIVSLGSYRGEKISIETKF